MKIAACLIVRNSAETIADCLDHIRPFVDEVNIYDTGSTDDTLAILERLSGDVLFACNRCGQPCEHTGPGKPKFSELPSHRRLCECVDAESVEIDLAEIRVEQGEWRDDFSWAREQSFAMCSDDIEWVIWLDDDDEVTNGQMLRVLAASASKEVDGFVVFYDYARDPAGNCVCQLWRERLIRRSAGYQWRGAVHEVLIPPDGHEPTLITVPAEQIKYVHHRPEGRYDPTRNLQILEALEARQAAEGKTPDPRTLAYLGTENMAQGEIGKAIPYLQAYVEHPEAAWSDERAQVMHKLATCLRLIGHVRASIEVERTAVDERADWAENAIGLAQSYALLEKWQHVELWARRALELGMPGSMLILNPLEFTFVPLVLLADAAKNLGKAAEAVELMRRAVQVYPAAETQQRLAELEELRMHSELVTAVLALRETLVRFDENQKALDLMEHGVPYLVADHPAIVEARALTRRTTRHLTNPGEYKRWYEDEPKESTVPDELVPEIGDHIERAKFLLETAQEWEAAHGRKPRMLDLGCNDAWLAGYLWTAGEFVCDGIELNKASVEKAQGRIERFGIPGKVVQGDLHDAERLLFGDDLGIVDLAWDEGYDIVSCFEVYEHVPDAERLLDAMESVLSPDGVACVTTPNGAFERGNRADWNKVKLVNHARAVPAMQLAEQLLERGKVEDFRIHQEERLTYAVWKPGERKSRIVFYNGPSAETWSPLSLQQGGIGGSETALVHVATLLAEEGHHVTVYAQCEPGLYGGVLWKPHTAFDPTAESDLLVVSRMPHVFENELGARRTALWCHDHSYPNLTEKVSARIDEVVVLSEWERDRFARLYPWLEGKLRIIRNGIPVCDREGGLRIDGSAGFEERKPVCVYSSSADRGLDRLLAMWPQIRGKVAGAELHVFYGWDTLDRFLIQNPALVEFKNHVLNLVAELGGEEAGIFMRGRVGQRDLSAAMQEARVWTYPSYFLETSCIGAMEARAAGLPIVTTDAGALAETVGEHGLLLTPEMDGDRITLSDAYEARFVENTIKLLTDPGYWQFHHLRALKGVETLNWRSRVSEWEQILVAEREAVAA